MSEDNPVALVSKIYFSYINSCLHNYRRLVNLSVLPNQASMYAKTSLNAQLHSAKFKLVACRHKTGRQKNLFTSI